ncbi:bifunctional UDP-N-acetylglucosamine diphosphorylase/glucosamine-1-phosphate N-acetyltransferase GlmU [Saccharospirillum impatiens]|uniref:bifunctional UDP-N-acetylglucosamine diphosphorylase/glucosamine-1-phosphate N-acetyltransferase GlmU n=1 Tax=Saccharospirillum impatiens TaxID=169438 RepID=UPI0004909B1D|nr:bifunctional UDP-N-acetylglucosamine diphosphorylase/glucosamine-1-phosphate N-acetyltransferase GlmU [Saccharospirillum impatiens]
MDVSVVILAAGQGSRMKSRLPKVLHRVAGVPMARHVHQTACQFSNDIHMVVGHGADQVKQSFSDTASHFWLQEEQLGTGHAVAQALPGLPESGVVLVLYGDVPLTRAETLKKLIGQVTEQTMGLLTVELDNPAGYGRIVRDEQGQVVSIVEHKDASPEQLALTEVNSGIMAMPAWMLHTWLPRLKNNNAQGEYYLTDLISMAVSEGMSVQAVQPDDVEETLGVNNRQQLAVLERWYQQRAANALMAEGATLMDPARIDIRGTVRVGPDCLIDVNAVFEGEVDLGAGVRIGPNCVIRNARLGDDVVVEANTLIDGAVLGDGATVGPFARLRPGTELATGAKVGNFVETKKASIGAGSKVNHLSYIGDAVIGEGANIGAGTITCNYDGANKFVTDIGAGAFIGSNSTLVAPVTIEAGAFVGAGSVLTKTAPADQLTVGRARQVTVKGWSRPVKP